MSVSLASIFSDFLQQARYLAVQIHAGVRNDSAAFVAALSGLSCWEKVPCAAGQRQRLALGVTAGIVSVIALLLALQLSSDSDLGSNNNCPPQPPPRGAAPGGAVSLLKLAYETKGASEWSLAATATLKQCVDWVPTHGGLPPLKELHAQLQCHNTLIGTMGDSDLAAKEKSDFAYRTRNVLSAIQGINKQCTAVHGKMQSLNRAGAAVRQPIEAVVALGGLAKFEESALDALVTLKFLGSLESGEWINAASTLRAEFHGCVLKSVRQARMIAHALPLEHAGISQVQRCKPNLLAPLERLALDGVEMQMEPSVIFNAGLLESEVSMAPANAPLFGPTPESSAWAADMHGVSVPGKIAASERLLLAGLEGSAETEVMDRSKSCTIQLATHAMFLTEMKQYEAAEWRYQAAADIAKKHRLDKFASSSLAQLGYFLSLHGDPEKALEAANDALSWSDDALASYLQATLRLQLGQLSTDAEVRLALAQLKAVKGKLSSQELEETRAAAQQSLESWGVISDTDSFRTCFNFHDAAEILVCSFVRLARTLA